MDFVIKVLAFIALGLVLLSANVWFIGLIYRSVADSSLVVAPIRIVGGSPAEKDMDEVLARMLLVRLRSLTAEFEEAQNSLKKTPEPASAAPPIEAIPFVGQAQTVRLKAQLFEPVKVDVKVAGVEVGGLVSWFQRWFAEDRTLSFTVSLQEHAAIIAGNVDALNNRWQRPIWVRIESQTPEAIVDSIAFAVIQRAWAKEESQMSELAPEEFRTLMQSIGKVSEINRRVLTPAQAAQTEYATVLNEVAPLAERITNWNKLTYFAAFVAEHADDAQRARKLYERLKESGNAPIANELLEQKLKVLLAASQNTSQRSLEEYRRQAAIAAKELSKLFGFEIALPPIELEKPDYLNLYWDGTKIHAPPGVEDIPDLIVHEMTLPFLQKAWSFNYSGQSGALVVSYTDVLTSVVKQALLHQSAEQADWTIGPGSIAWLTGKASSQRGADQRPLRSLKAPGTAYSDPALGKDPQVAHLRDFVTTTEDSGGIHVNSGIPNKAFYEAAVKIGTDKAARIWVEALSKFKSDIAFREAARTIVATATRLHGADSAESAAVQNAWRSVGL
jgi:Thermolysin metallopeptidase, alpha-helical domain